MNRGSLGARALNAVLQQALNPEATPQDLIWLDLCSWR